VCGVGRYKPSICDRAVCVMGYEELSLGFDLGKEIKEQPEVSASPALCTTFAVLIADV
jgi:hypothetical protein